MALAGKATSMGFFVQFGTNGSDLSEGYPEAPGIDRFIIPLESPSARVHDSLHYHACGHHAVIRSRKDELGQAGKSATISTVVTRHNIPQLPDLGALLSGYQSLYGNLHAWRLNLLVPMGSG